MMQIGKASYNVLKRSILRTIHARGSQILRAAGIGVDSSALQIEESGALVMATGTIILNSEYAPGYVIHRV